jgi:hypothetical protein
MTFTTVFVLLSRLPARELGDESDDASALKDSSHRLVGGAQLIDETASKRTLANLSKQRRKCW